MKESMVYSKNSRMNSFVKNAGMNSVRELALQKILTLDYCSLLRMQSVARCDEAQALI